MSFHTFVSFCKSVLRLGACACLFYADVRAAAVVLALAEILGIVEEVQP